MKEWKVKKFNRNAVINIYLRNYRHEINNLFLFLSGRGGDFNHFFDTILYQILNIIYYLSILLFKINLCQTTFKHKFNLLHVIRNVVQT